ncbi:MAG: alpha-amylase family glycosyl hydrolase [Geobacteraceae bacterium]|nr:alpha-amylase family glycosyl hydrolase [Geobacteraceae bacterium]
MTVQDDSSGYFRHVIQISARQWHTLGLIKTSRLVDERRLPPVVFYRQLALSLNRARPATAPTVYASHLNLFAILQRVYRYMIDVLAEDAEPDVLEQALRRGGYDPAGSVVTQSVERFVDLFPPAELLSGDRSAAVWLQERDTRRRAALREMLLLHLAAENPATGSFRAIFDDQELMRSSSYKLISVTTHAALAGSPFVKPLGCSLGEALWAPLQASPDSLADQIRFVRDTWSAVLPPELLAELATALDILLEEERERGWGGDPGPPPVLEFRRAGQRAGPGRGDSIFGGFDYPEYERFSQDADWMSNVVMMAKMVYVWLDQLSRSHGFTISRLDQIPDAELDRLAARGFTGLWLIGLWERSPASQRIKQICGNPEAIASAYSLYDYEVAADLGGWDALANLRERAARRGIRLASDMVPNHTGIYSRWVVQHPDWFVQTDYPPFPTYQFNGEDLSHDGNVCLQIEDGYWSKHDAAVVFKHYDRQSGRTRYIYHGNDGTSIPWNDTAQLNYLIPEVREAVIQTILHVARNFPIIRFDAAMTLAKKHYERLWFPPRGHGGGIPSRAEHGMSKEEFDTVFPVEFWREVVDRVALEAPGTLLLAEAFWMMEGYFVRTLGMHRVYNSAFMNMLKMEENRKYRQTIKNVLEFNPEVLKRFVNFMNNPDEKTAVEQFGTQGKYFGACVLLATMPGLPMFGHGQIEGFHEKYGMEYKRAYWDEQVDEGLVSGHELWIFPLLRRRWLFSGSENFMLYDFHACDSINENVFAYSNRAGDQRSLVLYHNSFSTAAGWIRETAGFAVKNGNGEPELHRTTLGRALGLSGEEGAFCAFSDHVTGLTYLRNARELCEQGLYVELTAYQFYVFLAFREIRDDGEGNWSRLCQRLDGRGVESLEDELKQLRYGVLNKAFKAWIDLLPGELQSMRDCSSAVVAARDFLIEMHRLTDDRESVSSLDVQLRTIETRLTRLAALLHATPGSKVARAFRELVTAFSGSADNSRLFMAWVLLSGMQAGILEQFGLDCTLRRMLDADGARHRLGLLAALLTQPSLSTPSAQLFSVSACRSFLAVHESRGVEWFNKERFEELGEWLALTGVVDADMRSLSAKVISAALVRAEDELRRCCELAAHAGYRTGLYRRMLLDKPERVSLVRLPREHDV